MAKYVYTKEEILDGIKSNDVYIMRYLDRCNYSKLTDFSYTPEEYKILDTLDFQLGDLERWSLYKRNWEFLLYLATKFPLKCNLQNDTNKINDEGIVTIYRPESDYNTMISDGFIPYPGIDVKLSEKPYIRTVEYYRMDYSDEEILYLLERDNREARKYDTIYEYLNSCPLWSIVSKAYLEAEAKKGNSFPIMFFDLDMLYSSKRPKTDMDLFQTCNSNYYTDSPPINSIAVTRYGSGMSRGMYHTQDRPDDICGYFFYNEPESTTYLEYDTIYTSFNKSTATKKLFKSLNKEDRDEIAEIFRDSDWRSDIKEHSSGELPGDLIMKFGDDRISNKPKFQSDKTFYAGRVLEFYAKEDNLDQLLCQCAKKHSYDIVVLTNMVGSHQVVTEVLDTRNDSFSHLWFKR